MVTAPVMCLVAAGWLLIRIVVKTSQLLRVELPGIELLGFGLAMTIETALCSLLIVAGLK